jgi:voltage-gated potassium channel
VNRPLDELDDDDDWSDRLLERLDAPMGALGVLFALLVLVETLSRPTGPAARGLAIASWILWAIFVLEFVVRAVDAPSTSAFLRRNWWQLIFLALPFLRFVRFLRALRTLRRTARVGRVISSMVRTGRSAGRRLTNRIGWLAIVTACVIVGGSQVVYELDGRREYGDALYAVAMATIAGAPLGSRGWLRLLDVMLATYSVVIFAAVAGSIGSFLLERGREEREILSSA